ncbi:GGDEF domain-containing protein [Aureimonas sp. AU12]|uniref:GGDEF domain-containing protein n=1 Tax=Aureimonas sp. AU12 TaxID=1638161 RepID=UPI00078526C0|nr:GGDEF domain-containing protein [Aureimonas sp. AU12]
MPIEEALQRSVAGASISCQAVANPVPPWPGSLHPVKKSLEFQLIARLDAAILALGEGGAGFAVLYLDLDGFKAVNDRHGHAAGDDVLRQAAGRLGDAAGPGSLLARLGGDEFAGILASSEDPREARRVDERMIAAVRRPIALPDGLVLQVGATIGVAFAPTDGTDPLTLLRKADGALDVGKHGGKRLVQIHIALAEAKAG